MSVDFADICGGIVSPDLQEEIRESEKSKSVPRTDRMQPARSGKIRKRIRKMMRNNLQKEAQAVTVNPTDDSQGESATT